MTQDAGGVQTYTLSIQVLLFMTALSLIPGALMMMTSFARIIIVLAILRQALGTQEHPATTQIPGRVLHCCLYACFMHDARSFKEVNTVAIQALPGGSADHGSLR